MNHYLIDASANFPEPVSGVSPTYDEIAERALQLYERRRGASGQDLEDWVNAERELRSDKSRTIASCSRT